VFASLCFSLADGTQVNLELRRALAAGVTGRDPEKVRAHLASQAALGIQPPPHVPMLYPLLPTLVTNASDIGVIGMDSTPEVEAVLFHAGGTDYLTVGSDHTDRRIEAASALHGKNSCPKIVGTTAWPVREVRDHWDELTLRCTCGDTLLQDGKLAAILAYDDLMAFVHECDGDDAEGRLVFSGTVPALAHPPQGDVTINLLLRDPVAVRSLTHSYRVQVLHEYFPAGS
jgi:hypothetical protein